MTENISLLRRKSILYALRRGTVPAEDLGVLAVGLSKFETLITGELHDIAQGSGSGGFKALRGEWGEGKTFFCRWFQERARQNGFVTSEVQFSETDTPLHKFQTVYKKIIDNLSTEDTRSGAMRSIIDAWFYALEEEVCNKKNDEPDEEGLLEETNKLMDIRLERVSQVAPALSACLRRYRQALLDDDKALAEGLISWLSGSTNVAASIKKEAGIKGNIDHSVAKGFIVGLLTIIRDSGSRGMVIVLDELETIQRARSDFRDRTLNGLRQLIDEIDANKFPGMYLLITGTPAMYDGNNGIQRTPALAQRLYVDFTTDREFDNVNAVQIRLGGFTFDKLMEVAKRVRDIYIAGSEAPERIEKKVNDEYLINLANALLGQLGDDVGISPRLFLKKLISDVMDRVEQHEDFDPSVHYKLTVSADELEENEKPISQAGVDDIDAIELPT